MINRTRTIALIHRSLGAVMSLLFVSWFGSGVVMTFAGFPSVSMKERADWAPALQHEQLRLSPAQALGSGDLSAYVVDVVASGERTLYRARKGNATRLVDAASGEPVRELRESEAREMAARVLGRPGRIALRLTDVDQWNPRADVQGQLPLLRIVADDAAGTVVDVSLATAEVAQRTTRRARVLAWIGAIPHWIYPVALRRHGGLWRSLVIALSAAGIATCVAGLLHGVRVARVGRSSARGMKLSWSPFRDRSLRWHHRFGLGFGVFALSWVLSGMLSLYPWAESARVDPTWTDEQTLRGGSLEAAAFTRHPADALTTCTEEARSPARRMSLVLAGGVPYYVCTHDQGATRTLRADQAAPGGETVPRALLSAAVANLGSGANIESEVLMLEPDSYYYPTHFETSLAFPVLRTRFSNGLVTYVDPSAGALVRRVSPKAAVFRWLYHGLHSFDFPGLYRHPNVWQPVILCFVLAGFALSVSGLMMSVRSTRKTKSLP